MGYTPNKRNYLDFKDQRHADIIEECNFTDNVRAVGGASLTVSSTQHCSE